MDKIELFTVYLKSDGKIKMEISEDIMESYNVDIKELTKRYNAENLVRSVIEFAEALVK